MKQAALIVFIKNFRLGAVKTRLAQTMGEKKALEIYRQLCTYTIEEVRKTGLPAFFYFSDFIDPEFLRNNRLVTGADLYQFRVQVKSDLGTRMHQAFEEVLMDHNGAFILGTDCPYFNAHQILDAVSRLESKDMDVVIGPADDGGYYGLGMKQSLDVFSGVDWSTDQVLEQTISRVRDRTLKYELLPMLNDVDYELDWIRFLESPSATYFHEVMRSSSLARDTADE